MVDLKIIFTDTGEILDLSREKFRINFQVSDFGDITKQHTNYSWGFDVPKTPENTQMLQGIGLIGDDSQIPYQRVNCHITVNGTVIEPNGRFQIKKTQRDRYRCFVQSGIIDFFRDIKDDKISEVLDLSAFDHEVTVNNIVASFDQLTYRYMIASYNGPPLADESGLTNLSPFALVPSINLEYLWNEIQTYYGWEFVLPDNVFLSNKWMTYPNALIYDDGSLNTLALWERSGDDVIVRDLAWSDIRLVMPWETFTFTDPEWITQVPISIGQGMRTVQPAPIRFSFYFKGGVQLLGPLGLLVETGGYMQIWHQGILVAQEFVDRDEEKTISVDLICQPNDVIICQIQEPDDIGSFDLLQVRVNDADFSAEQLGSQTISFSQALLKFKVKDFFKEIMMRYSLTAFPDIENQRITFLTLDDRLSAEVVDWSDRYIERKEESYVHKGYAQRNYLRHKYNNENEDHADGNLPCQNENLTEERDLYKSRSYAPEEDLVPFVGSNGTFLVPEFKMFDIEVQENPDSSDLIVNYKPLKDRFYFLEGDFRSESIYILGTEVFGFPVAGMNDQIFRDIADNWWSGMNQILENSRIHKIELELSEYDIEIFDLKKIYYFEQEASYYIIQKLSYEPGEISTADCVRIDYKPSGSATREADGSRSPGVEIRPGSEGDLALIQSESKNSQHLPIIF